MKKSSLLSFLCLFLFFSCSVQKRKYQNGFYVDWHSKSSRIKKADAVTANTTGRTNEVFQEPVTNYPQDLLASGEIITQPLLKKQKSFNLPEDTCDVLVFKDGSEIKAKVKEIGFSEIKYKRCDTPDGPMYISRKSELFMIKYANGSKEVIRSEAPEVRTTRPEPKSYQNQTKRYRKENHPLAAVSLVFGIFSIILAYISVFLIFAGFGFGVFALPIIAGLIALVSGKTAINRIREQPDIYKGKGVAIPGLIMGAVIMGIFALLALIALI
jgi:hypothetical protein